MGSKKYYWLKLKQDFFQSREIKKLRKVAGGDTYTIIYLKLQLLSIKDGGIIVFERTEDDIAEQLAIELDETVENVKITLSFLYNNKLVETLSEDEVLLNKVPELIGSETTAAERMRKMREKKKELNCNNRNNVTLPLQGCYTEKRDKRKDSRDKSKEKTEDKEKLFSEFWELYPIKKDKKKCRQKYFNIIEKKGMHELIICQLKAQLEHRHRVSEINEKRIDRFKIFLPAPKHPKTWLNNECWNDEIEDIEYLDSDDLTDVDGNIEKLSKGLEKRFGKPLTEEEKEITKKALLKNANAIMVEFYNDVIFYKTMLMRMEDIHKNKPIKEPKKFFFKGAFGEDKYLWRLTKTEEDNNRRYNRELIDKEFKTNKDDDYHNLPNLKTMYA